MLLLLFVAVCFGRTFPEYSNRLAVPEGWESSPSADSPTLPLTIVLKKPGAAKLAAFVAQVSDPKSKMYGQYKTLEEVRAMVAPSERVVSRVVNHLENFGFKEIEVMASGDLIRLKGTPAVINEAFDTVVMRFHHAKLGFTYRSVVPYSLDDVLAPHVDLVSGILHFPTQHKGAFYSPADSVPIGPSNLRTRYNVTDSFSGSTNATQAVAEFQGQYYSPQDLDTFFSKFVPGGNASVDKVIGPNNANDAGVEAELDIQYIMGVNPNAPTYFYSQSSFEFWSDLTAWIAVLNNDPKPPLVHSISYGEQKEHQTSGSYKANFDTEMQKLAARGITIIFASGDDGCGCSLCVMYEPSFPASAIHVTAVGATTFIEGSSGPERAVTAFGSGGGFSRYYERSNAPWQQAAVSNYITNHGGDVPSQVHWKKDGRATPDVSALGWGFQVVVNGQIESIGGTSASAPTFAAIVSILNDQQLQAGKPPLGFLNPWLYQTGASVTDAFFDVTVGSNPDSCCTTGFSCAPGWDAVTGLGTPNYKILKQNLP
jgi:tripeptidyl-peptidase-1